MKSTDYFAEIPDPIHPSQHWDRYPESTWQRRLAYAVLLNGVAVSQGVFAERELTRSQRKRAVSDARQWLRSSFSGPFSRNWCCDILGIDPEALGAGVRKFDGQINLKVLTNRESIKHARPSAYRVRA